MRNSAPYTLKLPRKLLDEFGASEADYKRLGKQRYGPANRKEQRKAARVQKKSNHVASHAARALKHKPGREDQGKDNGRSGKSSVIVPQPQTKATPIQPKPLKSILKASKSTPVNREERVLSSSPPPIAKLPRRVQEQLTADDAEIQALEKALGIKGKKQLPKSFVDDGLDDLLGGIDDAVGLSESGRGKRKRSENEEWLDRKRQKAYRSNPTVDASADSGTSDDDEDSADSGAEEDLDEIDEDEADSAEQSLFDKDDGDGSLGKEDDDSPLPFIATKVRENPYVAPTVRNSASNEEKYIPPSLRHKGMGGSGSEDLSQLRRQIQGLLNRLSEANLSSILSEVEKMYRGHPRQHVSTILLDLLLGLLSDPTSLQDTFIILHAGFIAAVFKVTGSDFGAQAIERINDEFFANFDSKADSDGTGKKCTNLTSLLAELYNFQVISSNMIYDLARLFLNNLSEINTELLLRIVRTAGPQLRQDDPSSLKDIVIQLQRVVAQTEEQNLSVRTKFMIETMNDLKNNRMKTGIAASAINSEHTVRMKQILKSLNQRTVRASEPLRFGLKDLQDKDKRGKWWLVGASYRNDSGDESFQRHLSPISANALDGGWGRNGGAGDLEQLAKEQRMNTDVRRSIFIAIMSSSDSDDAYVRLMKLGLKKSQQLEIPKVLVHCAGAEKLYNPFYTILSRRICGDKKLKMALQFSLWDLFKRMGEADDEAEGDEDESADGKLDLRSIVNLARMFGVLIAEDGLSLGVLKNLNLAYLRSKTRTFVELMLVTAIIHSQQDSGGSRNEKALMDIFLKPKEISEMAGGLRYFLKKVVSKTDVAGSKLNNDIVRWSCKVASDALTVIATRTIPDEAPFNLSTDEEAMDLRYDVVVVGAGLQGLTAARKFLQLDPNLNLTVIDARHTIGGVWAEEQVYTGLSSNNLRGTYEYTDLPMDDSFGVKQDEHIPGKILHKYLDNYARKFDLKRRIQFHTKVKVAEKMEDGWDLQLKDVTSKGHILNGENKAVPPVPAQWNISCAKLIVATGLMSVPKPIYFNGLENFTGPVFNFADYALEAPKIYEHDAIKNVTVMGSGKSASDCVYLMAAHGKSVNWIIRASGHGPCYIAPAYIYLGPFRRWLEKLLSTRIFTLFSPIIWDEADGFGFVRSLLHGTTLGRWVVDRFWDKLSSDVIDQTHLAKHPETKKLLPTQNTFWCGLTIAILNYLTDFLELVRSGQVKVIREDVECIEDCKTIRFKGGSMVQTDALVCSMGWRFEPSIEFRPKGMHADLGIPSANLTRTQKEVWDRLNARADLEIFERFPRLKSGPKIDPDPLVAQQILPKSEVAVTAAPGVVEISSWRLWRGIAPPAVMTRDLVFLGLVQTAQGALRSEISSIWAYAYMYDKLQGPFKSVAKPSIPLQPGQTLPTEKQLPAAEKGEFDEFMYDTALCSRFGKWRTPWGYGARYMDLAFDGIPYLDMLLGDLGLKRWRKGWGWLGEIFGGAYDADDYRGLAEEWKQKQEKKDRKLEDAIKVA